MNNSTTPAQPEIKTYICERCQCEHNTAAGRLPAGWRLIEAAPHCDNCLRFVTYSGQTHDSTSAINDEHAPQPPTAAVGAGSLKPLAHERQWQIITVSHTDKGIVESSSTVRAHNPMAAIDELEVNWLRISEMVSVSVTAAPLEVN